jgi:hypothetical protein
MSEIITDGHRKARKPHRCNWCEEQIEPKALYYFQVIKYDYVYECKFHIECISALSKYFKAMTIDNDDCGYIERGIRGKPWTIEEAAEVEKKITPEQIATQRYLYCPHCLTSIYWVVRFQNEKYPAVEHECLVCGKKFIAKHITYLKCECIKKEE